MHRTDGQTRIRDPEVPQQVEGRAGRSPVLSVPGGSMPPCGTRSTFRASGSSRHRRSSPRWPAGPRMPAGTRCWSGITWSGRRTCTGNIVIGGASPGGPAGRDVAGPLADLGVTWWDERMPWGDDLKRAEPILRRIEQGRLAFNRIPRGHSTATRCRRQMRSELANINIADTAVRPLATNNCGRRQVAGGAVHIAFRLMSMASRV
jgi:hypothetical protein